MRRLLIVDDEPDVCECLRDFFSTRGFAVEIAFSGEEALERILRGAIEVLLLDIMLPGISGLEVLKRVKEVRPYTRVVMMTGLSYPELRRAAQVCGACGYVTKPFDFTEVTWEPVLVA